MFFQDLHDVTLCENRFVIETQTQGRIPCEDRGRVWSERGHNPQNAKECQKPAETRREAWNRFSPQGGTDPTGTLILDFNHRTAREWISVVLNHPLCGNLIVGALGNQYRFW